MIAVVQVDNERRLVTLDRDGNVLYSSPVHYELLHLEDAEIVQRYQAMCNVIEDQIINGTGDIEPKGLL